MRRNVEEIKLEMDGTYMNIIRFGKGPENFVLISGVSLRGLEGQGAAVANDYEMFTEKYTVYVFDRKKVLPEEYYVEDLAEDIYRALKILHVEQADFYGVSQGGMIAQYLAVKYPELVSGLVLCSTVCKSGEIMKENAREWQRLAGEKNVAGLNRYFFKNVYSQAFLKKWEKALPLLEKMGTDEDCVRFKVLARACEVFDIAEKVQEIQCPVLVLGDQNDRVLGVEGSCEIAEKLHCQSYIYDQFGHAVYDEAPDIKERVLEFLQECRKAH